MKQKKKMKRKTEQTKRNNENENIKDLWAEETRRRQGAGAVEEAEESGRGPRRGEGWSTVLLYLTNMQLSTRTNAGCSQKEAGGSGTYACGTFPRPESPNPLACALKPRIYENPTAMYFMPWASSSRTGETNTQQQKKIGAI